MTRHRGPRLCAANRHDADLLSDYCVTRNEEERGGTRGNEGERREPFFLFRKKERSKEKSLWLGEFIKPLAIDCLQTYHMKTRGEDAAVDAYVPVIMSMIRQIGQTGINYGVIVVATDSDALEIGDIIIAIDKQPCFNESDFKTLRENPDGLFTVMRRNADHALNTMDIRVTGSPQITIKAIEVE